MGYKMDDVDDDAAYPAWFELDDNCKSIWGRYDFVL